ncbi:MAG: 4-demethylwyosine synthase TYW1 [Candidatus Aenigmarchaeota archaeon]|nr:4-demethylwyosine synthase TYW1 [Candidatus Aenigmarchaeota archaeon]
MNKRSNESPCDTCNSIPEGFVDVPKTLESNIDERLAFMREKTTKIGYRFVGRHSAIKVCNWTKETIRGHDTCYKKTFYNIDSNRCIQMTPVMFFCTFNCRFCWRNFNYTLPRSHEDWDDPKTVLDGIIHEQVKFLQGFFGSATVDKEKLAEAMTPRHVAISLSGEPCLYPHLPAFIDEIKSRGMTAFLVTNGTVPAMTEKLLDHQPTNMYLSLYGTTPEMYQRTAVPLIPDFWDRVMTSLAMLGKFDCNTVVRLTLTKGLNFTDPEGYARLVEQSGAKFVEVKSYMAVGGSRKSLQYTDMPLHEEIRAFAEQIAANSSYRIAKEKKISRVVLLERT